jgi:hypothetical protein
MLPREQALPTQEEDDEDLMLLHSSFSFRVGLEGC